MSNNNWNANNQLNNGIFITLEGIEGSGKSSLTKWLQLQLQAKKYSVQITNEPGGKNNLFGQKVRQLILESDGLLTETEFLLFSAFRNEHIQKTILPWLVTNDFVICDRFIHSSMVYQGLTQKGNLHLIKSTNEILTQQLNGFHTFLIDLDVEIAKKRITKRDINNRFDHKANEYHNQIRQNYLDIAKSDTKIIVIDGNRDLESIGEEILNIILSWK